MILGAHASIEGGLHTVFQTAQNDGSECIQLFSKPSQRWSVPALKKDEIQAFRDARAAAGETEFYLGDSLRATWHGAQRADKNLMPMFSAKTLAEGYRLAKDGLLERLVNLPPPANDTWLPIVPDGQATSHLTWKR